MIKNNNNLNDCKIKANVHHSINTYFVGSQNNHYVEMVILSTN